MVVAFSRTKRAFRTTSVPRASRVPHGSEAAAWTACGDAGDGDCAWAEAGAHNAEAFPDEAPRYVARLQRDAPRAWRGEAALAVDPTVDLLRGAGSVVHAPGAAQGTAFRAYAAAAYAPLVIETCELHALRARVFSEVGYCALKRPTCKTAPV